MELNNYTSLESLVENIQSETKLLLSILDVTFEDSIPKLEIILDKDWGYAGGFLVFFRKKLSSKQILNIKSEFTKYIFSGKFDSFMSYLEKFKLECHLKDENVSVKIVDAVFILSTSSEELNCLTLLSENKQIFWST